jgi:tRNA 5-methylaminomethyl-2-thiouridine biosynthesis bifunctional protein
LATTAHVNIVTNTRVDELKYEDSQWHVQGHSAEVLVIANGEQATLFQQTQHIPLKKIRGQMTWINSQGGSDAMIIPLCADVHILPSRNGHHLLGATYHTANEELDCYDRDDQSNLSKLSTLSTAIDWSTNVTGHWSGIRAATPDYLPLVGPVAKPDAFMHTYRGLVSNAKRWIPATTDYFPGLYLCAGFGSRGLTTIPLSAEWLASMINQEFGILPRTIVESLSPSRFMRRDMIRSHMKE